MGRVTSEVYRWREMGLRKRAELLLWQRGEKGKARFLEPQRNSDLKKGTVSFFVNDLISFHERDWL